MQELPTLRKWSDLSGLAVVAIDTGKKVGTINDFYFDISTGIIQAFQIKTGLFGHRVLLSSTVKALGMDALTFEHEEELIKTSEGLATMATGNAVLNYRILSEGGNLVGNVGNLILDATTPTQLRIAEFELAGGLREKISGKFPTFSTAQVVRYGEHVLIIPDTLAQAL